jgi:cystathionine beta-lyase/cystathionine gamma-synthase
MRPDDLCPRPERVKPMATVPVVPAIYPASVYQCLDPRQAEAILSGQEPGYVYSRDGHPNADLLAEKCRCLHGAERALVVGSGMAALAVAALAHLEAGSHVVLGREVYGKTSQLLAGEFARLGVRDSVVDTCNLEQTARAFTERTRLLVVETITNPLLRVADLAALAQIAHAGKALLLVDNTFASPAVCRPFELGADLVQESLTKIMNGHSDVLLGLICGREAAWERMGKVVSCWGFSPSPFDCWLAARGIGTLALRIERACENALAAARFLAGAAGVREVYYPGLESHLDHQTAVRQFGGRFGHMVSFTLEGGLDRATAFIRSAANIPFCPSLGDISTTLSHPASTSHRAMTGEERTALGIDDGTIRLSVGIESAESIVAGLAEALGGEGHRDIGT